MVDIYRHHRVHAYPLSARTCRRQSADALDNSKKRGAPDGVPTYRGASGLNQLGEAGGGPPAAAAAGGRMVRPGDCVGRIASGAGAGEPKELADDAGAAHRPSGTGVQCAWRGAVLVIRPAHAVCVGRRPVSEVCGENAGEVETLRLLHMPVARQREDSRGPAAVTAVVPEPGPEPARQAAVGDGAPASIGHRGPGGIPGDRAEQPEHLSVASGAVAPAV